MGESAHERDLARVLRDMREAREPLLSCLRPMGADDFARSRPGGWSVGRVAKHLVDSDVAYAKLLAFQTSRDAGMLPEGDPADGAMAAEMLERTQAAMLTMVEGIDADTLYRMIAVGHEEYSPLSLLENIAMHDGEHLAQMQSLLRDGRGSSGAPARAARSGALTVRAGEERDVAAINDLYNQYIRETAITFDIEPWSIERRRDWFAKFAPTGRHRLFVAEEAGTLLGFAGTGQFRAKEAYDPTVETTIYCAAEATGRGIGSMLYERLFDELRGEDINAFVAGITLPNDASCALHERFGFRRVGVFHEVGRKFGRFWDVVWYERPGG